MGTSVNTNAPEPHRRAFDGEHGAELRQRRERLLLRALHRVHGEVNVAQRALDHPGRVRPVRLRVHALVHENVDDVAEERVEVELPLLVRDLHLADVEDDAAYRLLVRGPERSHQVLLLREDALADVVVDLRRLHDVVHVLLELVPPRRDGVLVARDLEPDAVLLQPHHRDVRQLLDPGRERELRDRRTAAHDARARAGGGGGGGGAGDG
eukprot:2755-Pelagococcus_subviridis.AAC.1